jgi:hypothetical protein
METYMDGRLVKHTSRVDVSEGGVHQYVPGRFWWELDGQEITDPKFVEVLEWAAPKLR